MNQDKLEFIRICCAYASNYKPGGNWVEYLRLLERWKVGHREALAVSARAEGLTYQEIANRYNISRERARQLVRRAIYFFNTRS